VPGNAEQYSFTFGPDCPVKNFLEPPSGTIVEKVVDPVNVIPVLVIHLKGIIRYL
jgi:hypothetical protein